MQDALPANPGPWLARSIKTWQLVPPYDSTVCKDGKDQTGVTPSCIRPRPTCIAYPVPSAHSRGAGIPCDSVCQSLLLSL